MTLTIKDFESFDVFATSGIDELSTAAFAQHDSEHSFSYELGLTGTCTLNEMWFTHELDYTYWFAPYTGVKGSLRLDKQGRIAPKLGGTGTIDGFSGATWDCNPPVRFALSAGIALASPALKLKNTDVFLFCEPDILLSLPWSVITASVYYPNGTLDTKSITSKAQWISAGIDMGATFKFKGLCITRILFQPI